MKQLSLILACSVLMVAEQAKQKIEWCGLGSSHECHCVRKSQAFRQAQFEKCDLLYPERGTTFDNCIVTTMLSHCDLVDNYMVLETGDPEKDQAMGEHCSMICKVHDCRCDDGPTCHFGHSGADHRRDKPRPRH